MNADRFVPPFNMSAMIVGILLAVCACAGTAGWLGAPAGTNAPKLQDSTQAEQLTFQIPGGGILTMPTAPTVKRTWHIPNVGDLTFDPAGFYGEQAGTEPAGAGGAQRPTTAPAGSSSTSAPSPASVQPSVSQCPTNGDAVGDAGGGIVGLLTGNPLIGVLAAAALKEAIGALVSKVAPKSNQGTAGASTAATAPT